MSKDLSHASVVGEASGQTPAMATVSAMNYSEKWCVAHTRMIFRLEMDLYQAYLQAPYSLISGAEPSAEFVFQLNQYFLCNAARLLSLLEVSTQLFILFLNSAMDDVECGYLALVCSDPVRMQPRST